MLSVTGQRGKSHRNTVIQPTHPIVTLEQLNDVNSDINQRELSGKQLGSCVLVEDGEDWVVYMATGSSRTDPWKVVGSSNSGEEETKPKVLLDVFEWEGVNKVQAGALRNLLGLTGIKKTLDNGVVSLDSSSLFKVEPLDETTAVVITISYEGKTDTEEPSTWRLQVRDKTMSNVLHSVVDGRASPRVEVENREISIVAYTLGKDDVLSKDGNILGIMISSTQSQSITLTKVKVSISRI